MKSFNEETSAMTDIASNALTYSRAYITQDAWRWIPSSLLAVLVDASAAFTELFWIIILLWLSDLVIGFLRAFHSQKDQIEWVKVFRSVVKLFVITLAVISMNAIEQMLGQMGLETSGKLVVATMLVIGSADALSIMSNLSHFWPGLAVVGDRVRDLLGQAQSHDRRTGDD